MSSSKALPESKKAKTIQSKPKTSTDSDINSSSKKKKKKDDRNTTGSNDTVKPKKSKKKTAAVSSSNDIVSANSIEPKNTLPTIYDPISLINTNNIEIPKPGFFHTITNLLCCLRLYTNRDRKMKRQILKQNEVMKDKIEIASDTKEVSIHPTKLDIEVIKIKAAIIIQSKMRSYLVRHGMLSLFKKAMNEALSEANRYWLYQQKILELQNFRKMSEVETRRSFTGSYVGNMLRVGLSVVSQTSEASTEIQRIFRGYKTRKLHPIPIRPKWIRPVPKVPKKNRYSAEVLRRIWARTLFQPVKKWLHTSDYGQLYYNMWDYADEPPQGVPVGLRTHKTKIVTRISNHKERLLRDHHAWVSLPIGFESNIESKLKRLEAEADNVTKLKGYSPYNAKVVNYDSIAEDQRAASSLKENFRSDTSSHSSIEIVDEKHQKYQNGSDSGNSNYDNELLDSYTSSNDDDAEKQKRPKRRTEKQILKEIEMLGFNSVYMDPIASMGLPNIGALSYDLQTGRRIIHKGGNRWQGLHNPSFIVQYENHINTTYEEPDTLNADIISIISNNTSLDLLQSKAHIREHKSGVISFVNNDFHNVNSTFLKKHRTAFLDTFSRHDLSDYNGLQSSSYYDSLQINGNETNIVKRSQNIIDHTSSSGVSNFSLNGSPSNFSIDESVDNFKASNTWKTVSYTKDGNPIRGARKPRSSSLNPNLPKSTILNFNGFDKSKLYESSSWGKLKSGADKLQQQSMNDATLRNRLNKSAMKGVDLENDSFLSYDQLTAMEDTINDDSYGSIDEIGSSYDSEDEMWKNRSVFKPKKPIHSKVVVWKKTATQHYKLKYSWLPQPLVHNAVNNVYYEKTVKDFYSDARERNKTDFKKEIFLSKEKSVLQLERSSMLQQVKEHDIISNSQEDELDNINNDKVRKTTTLESPSKFKTIIDSNNSAILSLQSQGYRVEPSKKNTESIIKEIEFHKIDDNSPTMDAESHFSFSLKSENVNSAEYDYYSPGSFDENVATKMNDLAEQNAMVLMENKEYENELEIAQHGTVSLSSPIVAMSTSAIIMQKGDEFSSVGSASAWNEGTETITYSNYSPKSILKHNQSKRTSKLDSEFDYDSLSSYQNLNNDEHLNHFIDSPNTKKSIAPYIVLSNVASTTSTMLSPKFKYKDVPKKPAPPPLSELTALNNKSDHAWR